MVVFNMLFVGIVFVIEELICSFFVCVSGVLIIVIIFVGVVVFGLNGNYMYFGMIDMGFYFLKLLVVVVLVIVIVMGIVGGLFCWLLFNMGCWLFV